MDILTLAMMKKMAFDSILFNGEDGNQYKVTVDSDGLLKVVANTESGGDAENVHIELHNRDYYARSPMTDFSEQTFVLIDPRVPTEKQMSNITVHLEFSDGTSGDLKAAEVHSDGFPDGIYEIGFGDSSLLAVVTEEYDGNSPVGLCFDESFCTGLCGGYKEIVGGYVEY